MGRLIIYGDIHGCLDEWQELRKTLRPKTDDFEISVGDLVNKGPQSLECLRLARKEKVWLIRGNNEAKWINQKEEADPRMNEEDLAFLKRTPLYARIGRLLVVHAGVVPPLNPAKSDRIEMARLMSLRYVGQGKTHRFWSEAYDGSEGFVVYGHTPFKTPKEDAYSLGIDTGCVYGGALTAAVFPVNKQGEVDPKAFSLAQVKAKGSYV